MTYDAPKVQSLIVDLMRTRSGGSVFLHVYVWSPSIHMDPVWQTVKDFAKKVLKQNEEECFFEEFNPPTCRASSISSRNSSKL